MIGQLIPLATGESLDGFGHDPVWLVIVKAVLIFVILVLLTLFNIWFERRVVARMQHRIGPNVHGPFGLLQSLADGVKLALKEDIIPKAADKLVFIIAPVIATVPAFVTFAVIPFGPEVKVPFTDITTPMQLTDMPVAVIFVMAIASIGIYGIVLGGWSSGSTYSLLGGLRSSAQMISYEVAMGLAFVAVFLHAQSMSTSEIVAAQHDVWFLFTLLPSFVIYLIAMIGETNRAPFDLPEAEGELVGGFHTEYSSLKFALFFLAEYINMATVSALAVTLFLGGWRAPWPISIWDGANEGYWPFIWFMAKVMLFIFVFIWLRGTLPRLRYDQFMAFGWKVLIPISVVWIVAVAAIRVVALRGGFDRTWLIAIAAVLGVLVVVLLFFEDRDKGDADEEKEREPFDAFAGGYPVPPMPDRPKKTGRSADGVPERTALGPGRRVRGHLPDDVPQGGHRAVPLREVPHRAAVPRTSPAQPVARRAREVHRLRAVRVGMPGGRDLCRGCVEHDEDERFSPGERYGRVYQINYLRCILCGLCIEACPTRALTMTNEYELADNNREDLIYEKSNLLAPLLPGMEQPPHAMRLGESEDDYYRGTMRRQDPESSPQGGSE